MEIRLHQYIQISKYIQIKQHSKYKYVWLNYNNPSSNKHNTVLLSIHIPDIYLANEVKVRKNN